MDVDSSVEEERIAALKTRLERYVPELLHACKVAKAQKAHVAMTVEGFADQFESEGMLLLGMFVKYATTITCVPVTVYPKGEPGFSAVAPKAG